MTGPALVYILCLLTSALCAGLLIRSWFKTRTRLLLWTAVSFVFLAVNNLFLFIDTTVVLGLDLSFLRISTALVAAVILIVGLIWEAE